jgi:hypothetical protein
MQQEKFNKPSDLQSRLEGLEQLPGEPAFDTAAVWSRLERRLDNRPASRRRHLLWAAACFLLVAVGAAWLRYQVQVPQQVQQPMLSVLPPSAKSSVPVPPAALPAVRPSLNNEQRIAAKPVRKSPMPVKVNQQEALETVPQPLTLVTAPLPDVQLSTAEPTPTDKIALVEKAPPQKLKVVHLNEINGPVQTSTPAPSGSLLANRAAAPAYQEGRAGIVFSRNTSDDLIKISISPTN